LERAQAEAEATVARTGDRPLPADSQRRQPAETSALADVAGVFGQLEKKMAAAGAFRADDVAATPGAAGAFGADKASPFAVGASAAADAFAAAPAGAAPSKFAPPKFEPPKFEPPRFEPPKFAPRFEPKPVVTAADAVAGSSNFGTFEVKPDKQPAPNAEALSFDDLVQKLSQSGLFSSDRDKILAQYRDRVFILRLEVERVERTFGFDLPDNLRDGRTVEGRVSGKDLRVAARYPAGENERLDRMQPGVVIEVQGSLAAWDDLFKKATLNGF
jgi:hypothetical protein